MPIRPELRNLYRTPTWYEARALVMKRARGRCEDCGRPGGVAVLRRSDGRHLFWRDPESRRLVWFNRRGWPCSNEEYQVALTLPEVRTVTKLAPGHLNHVAGDDRPENLRVWCGWCHTTYDRSFHKATRSTRKDAERPLLREVA